MGDCISYNPPEVAIRIKAHAKKKGVSLKALLEKCGLGSNTFSHMLHGRAIAFDSLARIADYLDCSVDYLLGRSDQPDKQATQVTDNDLKFALFGGENGITDAQLDEVKKFAAFIKDRDRND